MISSASLIPRNSCCKAPGVWLDLKVSDGHEIGSWRGSASASRDIFDFIGGGAYGTVPSARPVLGRFANAGGNYAYLWCRTAEQRI